MCLKFINICYSLTHITLLVLKKKKTQITLFVIMYYLLYNCYCIVETFLIKTNTKLRYNFLGAIYYISKT